MDTVSPVGRRLKQARLIKGITQKNLGVMSGLDSASASSRMNHYERGRHEPSYSQVVRFASVLGFPVEFFYSEDDDLASVIVQYAKLNEEQQALISSIIGEMLNV
ncbi:helix-turn-helix domain-containing protein [Pseudomonadota bacterium]